VTTLLSRLRRSRARPGSRRSRTAAMIITAAILALQIVLGTPQAAAAGASCTDAPAIDAFNGGLSGAIDGATGQGLAGSAYIDYGYSGEIWHVYEPDSPVTCVADQAGIDTWIGNEFFNGAKTLVAITNSLHYLVYQGGVAANMDDIVTVGADATFRGGAMPFLSLALVILSIALYRGVFAGRLAVVAKGAARTLIAVTFIAMTAFSPLLYSKIFDGVLVDGVHQVDDQMNSVLYGPGLVYRDVLPTTLHDQVVYNNWLRGEFGDATSKAAQQNGRKLLDAQAFTWAQVRNGDDGNQTVVDNKHAEFKDVANALQSTGSYGTFTGASGGRVGTGALALTEAALFTPLQITAKGGWLFAQIVARILVLFGGMIGLAMLISGVARRIMRAVGSIVVLGVVFWGVGNIHAYLLKAILEGGLPLAAKLALMALITMLIWAVARPVRRLRTLLAAGMYAMPGESAHRWAQRLQTARLRSAIRRAGRRRRHSGVDSDFWRGRGGAAAEDTAPEAPGAVQATTTVIRPEAATTTPRGVGRTGPAASLGRGLRGGGAAAADSGSGAPLGPRGPHDPTGPWGHGAAASPPPIRVEGTIVRDSLSGAAPSRRALPSGATTDSAEDATQSRPETADLDETDPLVRASEIDKSEPRQAERTQDDNGRDVYRIYRPSTGQVETGSDDSSPAISRPELNDDHRMATGPHHHTNTEGDNDADSY
jgi:hypothetical protein